MDSHFELLIAGAGPAGLSAALMAGRAKRKVLVVDGGLPRNVVSDSISGYLSRDGIPPEEFHDISMEQVLAYPTVEFRQGMVFAIQGSKGAFSVNMDDSADLVTSSRVLLSIGMEDILPDIQGLKSYWGKGVYHCPYCDGYEHTDGKWALLADSEDITEALFLRAWTSSLVYLTNGYDLPVANEKRLRQHGIDIEVQKIAQVMGSEGIFSQLQFENGMHLKLNCLWIAPKHRQRELVLSLHASRGLQLANSGEIFRDINGETNISGIYAAGDIGTDGIKQALLAAADGARVALCINKALIHQMYY
jgi:thioredoxin reductase